MDDFKWGPPIENIETHFHPCLPWATASGKKNRRSGRIWTIPCTPCNWAFSCGSWWDVHFQFGFTCTYCSPACIYIYVYTSSITYHHISSCIIIYHHISLHIHQIWTDIFRKCCLNSSSRQFLWTKHHTSSSENDADRLGARSLQVSVMPKSTGWLSEIQEMNNSLRWGMTDGPRF